MNTTLTAGFDQATLERFADLTVGFAANVQRGQIVAIGAELGKEAMVRALAASAYRHGARFVDVSYFDMHVKRARILHADEDTLDFVPAWYGERLLELGRQRAARIGLAGPATPGLLDDLDPARAGRDLLPALKETGDRRQRGDDELDDRALPDRRPGRARSIPTSPRRRRWPACASRSCTSAASTRTTRSPRGRRAWTS